MLKTYTMHTSEADSPALACREIEGQLAAFSLLTNTVGIVICHYDFADNGVVAALQEALPFPLIGATSFYQATPGASGLFELTVTVLTSDDVRFALGSTQGTEHLPSPGDQIRAVYERANGPAERPSLMLSFLSANRPVTGDEFLRVMDDCSGGVPNFGMVNAGDDDSGANIYVICDGHEYSDAFAILLFYGDVYPKFYVANLLEEKLLSVTATVTEAEGVYVRRLNGQPVTAFLEKHGVSADGFDGTAISTLPFFCRRPGEERMVGRALRRITERGELEFMAEVEEGSLFRMGTITSDDILEETKALAGRAARENEEAALLLMASCVGRFIILGLDTTSEMDQAAEQMPQGLNYLACYAGGEVCPVPQAGGLANRFHNNSFIICALY